MCHCFGDTKVDWLFGCFYLKQNSKIIYKILQHNKDQSYNNCIQSCNRSPERDFEIIVQYGRNFQKTLSPEGLFTKSHELKHSSRSSLLKVLSNKATQEIQKTQKKNKTCSEVQKLKDHWPFARRLTNMTLHHRLSPEITKSLSTTFPKNTFGELLLVFLLFKQFDLKIRIFILKF